MKRHFDTAFKTADMYKQRSRANESTYDNYPRRRRSPSPYRRESSRGIHSRFTNRSSEDDYKSFQYSPSHESMQMDSYKRKLASSPTNDEQFHSSSPSHGSLQSDSYKRKFARSPPYDEQFHFSSPSHESLQRDSYKRKLASSPPDDAQFHSSSPSHESLQRDSYKRKLACSPPDDAQFHSRSFPKEQKETKYSMPPETKSQEPESKSSVLHDYLPQLQALPAELFLKIVYLKLGEIEVDGFTELTELAKFISKAQNVFAKTLPPEVEAVVRQMMFNKTGMNLSKPTAQRENTQVSEPRRERQALPPETDLSFLREILNKANRKDPPPSAPSIVASHQNIVASHQNIVASYPDRNVASHQNIVASYPDRNVASHQNVLPYPGVHGNVNSPYASTYTPSSNVPYSYNTASSNMTPGIPGLTLTKEQREAYSAYNAYQSPNPSSSIYHNYRF